MEKTEKKIRRSLTLKEKVNVLQRWFQMETRETIVHSPRHGKLIRIAMDSSTDN